MGIKLNPGCCCGDDYPAWTVYHSNVSEQLHYYIMSTSALCGDSVAGYTFVYLFYEGLSGDYLIYKNCPYFSTSGGGSSSEFNSSATVRVYLQQTNVAPTGGSVENTWIKAARVERVEVSGIFYRVTGPTTTSINTILKYNSSKSQYTMGMHYCGNSGFSGALTKDSGTTISGFTLFPVVAGKASISKVNPLSQISTIGDSFNIYTVNNTNNASFNHDYTPDRLSSLNASGVVYYSSGINSSSRTLIWENSGCACISPFRTYDAHQYEYTFNCTNYTSGTYFSIESFKYPLELITSAFQGMTCTPTQARNSSLVSYDALFDSAGTLYPVSGSYYNFDGNINGNIFNGGNFNTSIQYSESFSGYLGGCYPLLTVSGVDSGIYFCVSGNNPSGFSYVKYQYGYDGKFLIPYKPVLASVKTVLFSHTKNIVSQFMFDTNTCGDGPFDPTGYIGLAGNVDFSTKILAVKCNYNYGIAIGILNTFPSKHLLEDFNLDSDFETQTIMPWFGGIASGSTYSAQNICPSTGTGIYTTNYGYSGSGTYKNYTYGCPLAGGPGPFTGTFSLPENQETYYNITLNSVDFTNLQLIVPSSELCL